MYTGLLVLAGGVVLSALFITDFIRWFDSYLKPKREVVRVRLNEYK